MSGRRGNYLLAAFALACLLVGGCGPKAVKDDGHKAAKALIEERQGVVVEGLRLVAAGYMVDFRYRVMDPEKAALLQDPRERPYLIDEATGRAFAVPRPARSASSGKRPTTLSRERERPIRYSSRTRGAP